MTGSNDGALLLDFILWKCSNGGRHLDTCGKPLLETVLRSGSRRDPESSVLHRCLLLFIRDPSR
jgi:hypothetical protein